MAGKFVNQARMTVSSTGTGSITLGVAVSPWNTFATAGVNDGDIIPYSIVDPPNSEKGWGVYTAAGPSITRNVITSTNGNNTIAVSSLAQIFIDPSSWDLVPLQTFPQANLGGL